MSRARAGRRLATALAALAVAGSAAAAAPGSELPRGIKGGRDHRVIIESQAWPWSAIGRLFRRGHPHGASCTGILIGSRTLLTAAHCVWDSDRNAWAAPSSLTFLAGLNRGRIVAIGGAVRVERPRTARTTRAPPAARATWRW